MRSLDLFLYSFAMFDTGAILSILVYFIMTLADLECDYLNPNECCRRLNWWTPWLTTAHVLLTAAFLLSGKWLLVAANLPVLAWLLYRYFGRRGGSIGVYDPTEVLNRGELYRHNRHTLIQIGFFLLAFFFYLYLFILSLIKADDKPAAPVYIANHL